MSLLKRFAQAISLVAIVVSSASAATNPRISVRPKARIAQKIDNTKLTQVRGSHPSRVTSLTDLGRIDSSTPMRGLRLVLKSSDEQEYALVSLLDQQQKAGHENYHQWLTPQQFGAAFGVESSDLAQVTGWLKSAGLSVDRVANSARSIEFSGTAGQVEKAFHTEMHAYMVNGEQRVSNATDISLPTALTPVVFGVARLNNFRVKTSSTEAPQIGVREADGTMHAAAASPKFTNPSVPVSGAASAHYVGGADYAALYDTAPLLANGINGTGVSIGLVEDSDINPSDVSLYRSMFGLPTNQPTIVHVGSDSGVITYDDVANNADVIGAVDAEVAGAVAPLASVYYVVSGTSPSDYSAVDNSAVYLVDNNLTDIISMSFGQDETESAVDDLNGNGSVFAPYYYNGDVQFFQALWEQAAAQGQSVFVTTGIGGPDIYNVANQAYEGTGAVGQSGTYSVNMYASTGYNVAVGSTEFNEGAATYANTGATPFWAATATAPPYATALGYIPENAWNQSQDGTINGSAIAGAAGSTASGGGVSAYNPLPNWQVGPAINVPISDPAVPTGEGAYPTGYLTTTPGPHRLLPDVAMASGTLHDGDIVCYEGNCTLTSGGLLNSFGLVTGTTASTPSMAGIQALINQANGGRQGNPNFYYYRIAAAQNETLCNSSTYPLANTGNTTSCGFHDITVGNTYIPANKNNTSTIGWAAGTGFDLTTGLGSPDAANLASLWSTVQFNPTTVGLNITDETSGTSQVQPIPIAHGDELDVSINVYPVNAAGQPIAGTPTGDVSLIAVTTTQGGVGFYNISLGGCANYAGPTVPITAASVAAPTGSSTAGYLYPITFTGNVPLGNVDEVAAGGYVLFTGLTGPFAFLNGTEQLVTASTGTTFQIQYASNTLLPALSTTATLTQAAITAYSVNANVVTLTAANTFTAGTVVSFSGLKVATFLNGQTATVLSTGLSGTQFEVAFTTANVATTADTGTATQTATAASLAAGLGTPLPTTCGGEIGDGNAYDALNNGSYNQDGYFPALPGGTYNVYAHYTGDTTYGASNSQMVAVSVSPELTTVEMDAYSVTSSDTATGPAVTTSPYGSNLFMDTFVTPSSGYGTPTGTITYTVTSGGTTLPTLVTKLDTTGDAFLLSGVGVEGFATAAFLDLPPNYQILPAGTYNFSATYSGDASFSPSTAPTQTIVVTPAVSRVTVTAETADISSTGTATLLATVANAATALYPSGIATQPASGSISFVDTTTNTTLGTCTVVAGACTFTTAKGQISSTGAHAIVGTFTDTDGNYSSGVAAKSVTVTVVAGATTTVALTQPTSIQVGSSASITANVTPTTATGTVAFYGNGLELGTGTLSAGKATATIANLSAGNYVITATYGGAATYDASASTTSYTLVVTPNTPSLVVSAAPTGDTGGGYSIQAVIKLSPNTITKALQPTPLPNPLVNFTYNTVPVTTAIPVGSANATIDPTTFAFIANLTTTLVPPGPGTITATYAGDANYTTVSASESVNLGLTSTAVSVTSPASYPTVGTGESVTFKAVVTPTTPTATTVGGTVKFYDNGTLLGSAATVSSTTTIYGTAGVATLNTTLSSPSNAITATYSGDTHFYTSTGTLSSSISTTSPGFTIASNPAALTISKGGGSGSVNITATVFGNWTGVAPLVCTGLPANTTCTFSYNANNPSVAGTPLSYFSLPGANGSGYTGTLTITSATPAFKSGAGASGLLWLPALMFTGLLALRRKNLSVRACQLLGVTILLCGALATSGCGSSNSLVSPTGSYTVVVTANGVGSTSASPGVQASTSIALTVQ